MIIELTMPKLSPTMEDGTIVSWKIKAGDSVKIGQIVAEIQTDKAVIDWESPEKGTVGEILLGDDSDCLVNTIIAVLSTKDDDDVSAAVAEAKKKNAALSAGSAPEADSEVESKVESKAPAPIQNMTAKSAAPAPATKTPAPTISGSVRVSPVAARMAGEAGIDLKSLKGSGTDGRIIKRDIEAAIASGNTGAVATARKAAPTLKVFREDRGAAHEDVGVSRMRAVIGQRLLEAKTTIPHFYVTESINMSACIALREQLNKVDGLKVTFNDLVTKATALALRKFPTVNSTFNGKSVRQFDSADISIAVAIPDGLITPIVFGAHALSVFEIGAKVRELAKKANAGSLAPEDFQGGSFTISNLGMYGIESFAAIINPPQAAILAVGGIKDEPVVENGAVVAGKTMRLTLACDHRVVDGAPAAEFLSFLRQLLESPAILLAG